MVLNFWDLVVLAALAVAIGFAVRRCVRMRREGGCCGGGCSGCGANCSMCAKKGRKASS